MERKHIDFVSAIAMLLLSIYVLFESWSFYTNQRIPTPFYESPGFFPFILGGALLVCSVVLLIRSVVGGVFLQNFTKLKEGTVTFVKSPTALRATLGILWMGVYIFILLPVLSFLVGTMLFLIVMITALSIPSFAGADKRKIGISVAKIVAISAVAVFATYGVFGLLFRVPLP